MNEHDYGTLERQGDAGVITFTRRLHHPPEKVWRAVTEPDQMTAWFPHTMLGDRETGAKLRFVTDDASDDGFDGEMLVFDPPSVMELMWGPDRLRIEVRPDGDGTLLTLVDTFDEFGKAARDAAGWHSCLDALAADLDGATPPGEVWREVNPVYQERFGSEASTVGPPES
jgi:uncharacterized protein YndB with AHSA1/START domain